MVTEVTYSSTLSVPHRDYSTLQLRKCNYSLSKISAKGIVFTCSYAVVISNDNHSFIYSAVRTTRALYALVVLNGAFI